MSNNSVCRQVIIPLFTATSVVTLALLVAAFLYLEHSLQFRGAL